MSWLNNKQVRDTIYQVGLIGGLVVTLVYFIKNASDNMVKKGIASGFSFLSNPADIDVPFSLFTFSHDGSLLGLVWVGVVNTLFITLVSMVFATALGFALGISRLSSNWLLSHLAGAYIEFVRNIPLLFFVFVWYKGIFPLILPNVKNSYSFFNAIYINLKGIIIPSPDNIGPFVGFLIFLALMAIAQYGIYRWASARRDRTGQPFPIWLCGLFCVVALPVLVLTIIGMRATWQIPTLKGFNFVGGFTIIPEFFAIVLALSTYTAGFIAEVVRGGIAAVPKGQVEAASALGLSASQRLRLVVIPQAMRIMIPPMTNQYLNVLKNSSFGWVIAFPEICNLILGTAYDRTGQAIETSAITLAVYLMIGLCVSALMNWYNKHIALVTR